MSICNLNWGNAHIKKSFLAKPSSLITLKFISPILLILISFLLYCLLANIAAAQEGEAGANAASFEDDYYDDEDFDFDFGIDSGSHASHEIRDPFEKINRKIFAFNEVLDKHFFEHVAKGYGKFIPRLIRKSVRNFLTNLSMPLITVNSILQGDVDNSLASFSHFLINSTIGVGGLFNVAAKKDIKYRDEDLGQTFAKYGIKQGPYLVLPFVGPNNLRDSVGMLTEALIDNLTLNSLEIDGKKKLLDREVLISVYIISTVDKRENLLKVIDDARKNSFDFYATARSAYIQKRNFEINNN